MPLPQPGPGQIRIDLRAASLIPADVKLRAGKLSHIFQVSLPKIPGRDGAGVVSALGAGVDDFKIGDRVCVVAQHVQQGTHAEAVVLGREAVVALPDSLGFAEGAALMHAGVCAWICLMETARITAGSRVLIHGGAGAIGSLALQLAASVGAEVLTTCRSSNRDYVTSLGADRAIAYDAEDFTAIARDMDVVLDLIGGETADRSWQVLKPAGHMVALIAKPFEDQSADFGVRLTIPHIHDHAGTLRTVVDAAAAGRLVPQIAAQVPLEEARYAHARLEAGHVSRGRLVFRI
ncbi:NADP-dependent oxidoreductase [Pseudooceanicola sp. CBS1P-1]|nr:MULTISPECIES: NADP-dependent oxidoreductase [Pseudooceanicola]MBT9386583.1 NADP-dependent oxidoreductase [Pseudooceanicola endophyticus]